ncbi:MAG: ATP-binding protein [Candidatus Omnitrophota bacterium]
MKISTKLTLLVFFLMFAFMCAFITQRKLEHDRLLVLLEEEHKNKENTFDKILKLRSQSLETLAYDYTMWDEMVDFVTTGDPEWAEQNIDISLVTYEADAAWVYNTSNSLVHYADKIDEPGLKEIPVIIARGDLGALFMNNPHCHFFTYTPAGLMEIRGHFIQPTVDSERKAPAEGYFFCGRLWNDAYVKNISELTETAIEVGDILKETGSSVIVPDKTEIVFLKILNDSDDKPLARLVISAESKNIANFKETSARSSMIFIFFLTGIIIVLFFSITKWISGPLRAMSEALEKKDPSYLDKVRRHRSEFGSLSNLIHEFFVQKDALNMEISEHEKTEKKLKDAYEQLKSAQVMLVQNSKMAAVGQLAGGVAHELNNPLTGVLNNVQLIKLKAKAQDKKEFEMVEFQELLDIIEKSSLRCKKIIQALLHVSRSSAEETQSISLNTVIVTVLDIISAEMKLSNISIELDLQPDLADINGEPQLLEQVILNLFSNAKWAIAKRFGKDGGVITIKTRQGPENKSVVLSFSDNGIGIPKENMANLFTPFFSTKTLGEGTGLGLAISYNIIKTHNASVTVDSRVNEGATFNIVFPRG